MKVLVISDVHANLPALQAVLEHAGEHDAIWNLGDSVGYGAHPNECLDLIAAFGIVPSLVGNHDLAAVGLLPIKWFNAYAATAAAWTGAQLSEQNRLRIRTGFTSGQVGDYYLVHGSPRDPARDYVQTLEDATDSLSAVEGKLVLCGHTHSPMLVQDDPALGPRRLAIEPNRAYELGASRALLNPGSVGQPRDGDSRASMMALDTEAMTVTWLRVPYDVQAAQQAILDVGLPRELATRLSYGR